MERSCWALLNKVSPDSSHHEAKFVRGINVSSDLLYITSTHGLAGTTLVWLSHHGFSFGKKILCCKVSLCLPCKLSRPRALPRTGIPLVDPNSMKFD